jgi:F-type H+-transporting ATPase subunit epsilon
MVQQWRAAGLTYLRYANICADFVRKALKEPKRTEALSRTGFEMTRSEWSEGKVVKRGKSTNKTTRSVI